MSIQKINSLFIFHDNFLRVINSVQHNISAINIWLWTFEQSSTYIIQKRVLIYKHMLLMLLLLQSCLRFLHTFNLENGRTVLEHCQRMCIRNERNVNCWIVMMIWRFILHYSADKNFSFHWHNIGHFGIIDNYSSFYIKK